jgi:hypothetical protein
MLDNVRIHVVKPLAGAKLEINFANGAVGVVDLTHLIARGNLYRQLGDPAYFTQVQIGDSGFCLAWPGGFEIGADSLWMDVEAVVGTVRIA